MKRFILVFLLILTMLPNASSYAASRVSQRGDTIVWSGIVQVRGVFTVSKGKLLEIRPGTKVVFHRDSTLLVEGRLRAIGLKSKEIIFTSATKGTGGRWHEIKFDSAGDSIMEHCVIENAMGGVHSHFTRLTLTGCTFKSNDIGLRFQNGPLNISKCRFTGNRIGLRSYRGVAQISESDFWGNEIGLFVREKGSGLNISKTNFFRNSSYNIRVGDFNDEDIEADGNWWGVSDPAATIFDAGDEPGIGNVLFEPFSNERISWQ